MSDDLTARIIGAAMEVHSILGPGLLESIYEEALCHEFQLRNIPYARQVAVDVRYKNRVIQGQRLDMIVFEEVVVEIVPDARGRLRDGIARVGRLPPRKCACEDFAEDRQAIPFMPTNR